MMRSILASAMVSTLSLGALPGLAESINLDQNIKLSQTSGTPCITVASKNSKNLPQINRTRNLARQAAEKANEGISIYRAEPAMHGPATEMRPGLCSITTAGVATYTIYGYPVAKFSQYDKVAKETPKKLPIKTVVSVNTKDDWKTEVVSNQTGQ